VGLLTEESNQRLPLLDTTNIEKAYQELCESLVYSAKQCVPNGHRKNYVSSSEKEFKILYRSLVRILVETDSDKATSSLLTRLGRKMHVRWEKTVNSINFSHSCCNALSNINKRTCKSENPSRLCPVSANTIASQIVRKGQTRPGISSPPCSLTRCSPNYGQSQHMRETVLLVPSHQKSFRPHEDMGSGNLHVWILSSRRLYYIQGHVSDIGYANS